MQDKSKKCHRLRGLGLQALIVVLLAPIFALAPAGAASAVESYETTVPSDFGVAVNQTDRFQFGNRVSSSTVLGASSFLQSASCAQGTRGESGGDNLREGYATSPYIQGQPYHARAEPGVRWKVAYCTVETPIYSTACDENGCWTYQSGVQIDHYYLESWEVAHSQLDTWLTAAIEEAWSKDENRDKVYWNSSPGYNSRQIIGLPSWFAASQNPVGITATVGSFNLGPFVGYGGPTDSATGEGEIRVELNFDPPSSTWTFKDGLNIDCPTAGTLWTESGAQAAIAAGGADPDLCLRGWPDSAVAQGSVRLEEMERVQLIYPYRLTTNADKAIGLANISFEREGEAGTKELGDSRDMVVGEVQTYAVDTDGALTADAGAAVSPWVGSSLSTCDQASQLWLIGWAAGAICKFVSSVYNANVAVLQLVWDGAQFVGTVVSVILSAVWDLITGCLGMVTDLVQGVGDIAGSLIDFVANPTEKTQEIIKSLDLIREQLSNPDTALEFATTVLQELVGEALVLDLIAERDDDPNNELGWKLKENPEWAKWIGRMVCEALVLVLTAGGSAAAKLTNSSRVLRRIQRFLDGINIPDINPCVLAVLRRGADVAGALTDAYEIAKAAAERNAQENNSFPAGTLVLMADGTHLAIEHVQLGDMVMSFDDANQIWEPQPVTDQWSAIDDGQLATLTLTDGSQIQATDGHPFFLAGEQAWVELEDVRADDLLLTPNGVTAVLAVSEAAPAFTQVYELSVAENYNFAVHTGTEDVLVHNRCRNRPNPGGDPDTDTDFRQDDDGNVTYIDEDGREIGDVLLDADGNPIVIKTDDFDVIVHTDGSVTVIDKDGNVYPGGTLNSDGSVSVQNADGSTTIIDEDGDTTHLPPSPVPFECNSFPTGTQVRMANGEHRSIEDIRPGDHVLSFDFSNEEWVGAAVRAQWSAIDDGAMATVSLTDGSSVTATDHHRFWNQSNETWSELDNLDPGNLLLSPQGSPVVADVVITSEGHSLVWELSVNEHSNFTVQAGETDLLVHNCNIDIVENADGSTTTTVTDENGTSRTITKFPDRTVYRDTVDSANGNPQARTTTVYPEGTVINGVEVTSVTTKGTATSTTRADGVTTIDVGTPPNVTTTTIDANGNVSGSNYNPANPAASVDINEFVLPRPNSYTQGVARGPNGELIHLRSGAGGPAMTDTGLNNPTPDVNSTATHVEGHAASYMVQNDMPEMVMAIDHAGGTCPTCQQQAPSILNPGQVLYVVSPDGNGGTRVQRITSNQGANATPPFVQTITDPVEAQAIIDRAN